MAGRGGRWTRVIVVGTVMAALAGWTAVAAAGLSSHRKGVTVPSTKDRDVSASCDSGSEAVSGGFASPGFDPQGNDAANLVFTTSRSHEDHWRVAGHNFGAASGKLFSYVYCDRHEPGLVVASKSNSIPASDHGSATAKCPRGTEAVSGGFRSPKAGPDAETLFAFTSKRVGDRKWKVAVGNNDSTDAHKLKAFAYCDKHQPGLVTRSKDRTLAGGDKLSLSPKCPNGRRAFSGGYASTIDPATDTAGFAFTSRRDSKSSWKVSAFGNGGGMAMTTSTETALVYCKKA
jgi:hypothetical protein